jgi:hypothetical protein
MVSFLRKGGYTSQTDELSYSAKSLVKKMREHASLAIGYGTKYTNYRNKAHVWLIDGYRYSYPKSRVSEPLDTTYMSNVVLHCNWGQGGDNNGYFSGNVMNGWTTKKYIEVGPYIQSKYNKLLVEM